MSLIVVEVKNLLRSLSEVLMQAGLEAEWKDFDRDYAGLFTRSFWMNVYNKPYDRIGVSVSATIGGADALARGAKTAVYKINYKFHVSCTPSEQLKAKMKVLKRGLLFREVAGFSWEGGYLADALNMDVDLLNMLSEDMKIEVEPKKDGAEITISRDAVIRRTGFMGIRTELEYISPFRELMVAEKIAQHITTIT